MEGRNGSNLSVEYEVTEVERYIEAALMSVVGLVAFTGNLSLWLIILRNRSLRTTSNWLILSLSLADLLVAVVNMPFMIATLAHGRWMFSNSWCEVLGFLTMVTFVSSVMNLGSISINRYMLICKPETFRRVYTKRNTLLIIIGTWLFSAGLALPPLVGWARYAYLPGQSFCFCLWPSDIYYTYFMVAVCFGGPCSLMTFSYVNIYREVLASRRKVGAHQASSLKGKDNSVNGGIQKTSQLECTGNRESYNRAVEEQRKVEQKRKKQVLRKRSEDLRMTLSFLVVVLTFIVCWLPYCCTMFWSVYAPPVPRVPDIVSIMLGYLNSGCNPIIYGLMNMRFREGFRRLYCSWRRTRGGNHSGTLNMDRTVHSGTASS